jgi:uncharacterized protein YdhG (YjbR/CyaY superfamily)
MTTTPIDAWRDALPEPVRARFATLVDAVRAEAPDATERLSYGMPTWHQRENLIHLGVATRHIGVYPGPEAITAFAADLSAFKTSKGAIQLPHDAALPVDLIRRIVRWRLDAVAAKGR